MIAAPAAMSRDNGSQLETAPPAAASSDSSESVATSSDLRIRLSRQKIEALADAWHVHSAKTLVREQASEESAREAVRNPSHSFHEMFHELFHSNSWKPLIIQENKYAAVLREKGRLGVGLLARVQAAQKIEFQDFVKLQYGNWVASKKPFRKQESQDYQEDDVDFLTDEELQLAFDPVLRETGSTVHLGGQLKKEMNVRLICAESFTFLRRDPKLATYDLKRVQACMNLYSTMLQGLVLIVDEWDVWRGIWKDLAALSSLWPELHFDSFEDQLSHARALKENWESGDLVMTKHSNFREIHILFHVLLTGNKMDSLESEDVNGRHPAVLALRNVMRQVWDCDVSCVTIPLLLFRQYHPFMTSTWCQKRAELIFKCVKGFMIEMSSLADDEKKTVQFLLPENTPESIFVEMNDMMSVIFRSRTSLVTRVP